MNVTCPNCATVYRVDPAKVPEAGVRARCATCNAVFPVRRETEEAGARQEPPRPQPPRQEPPRPAPAPAPMAPVPAPATRSEPVRAEPPRVHRMIERPTIRSAVLPQPKNMIDLHH